MKNIFIFLTFLLLTGKANAQGALQIINNNTTCSAVVYMWAAVPFLGDYACSYEGNQINLTVCCGSGSAFGYMDACTFQSVVGWRTGTNFSSCPTDPLTFQWTDMEFVITCPCTPPLKGFVGDPTTYQCFTGTYTWSGSSGSCSSTVNCSSGSAVIIDIY